MRVWLQGYGHRVRELFGPPTAAGWCRGRYRGEVLFQQGALQVDAGHFRFRVRLRHHH